MCADEHKCLGFSAHMLLIFLHQQPPDLSTRAVFPGDVLAGLLVSVTPRPQKKRSGSKSLGHQEPSLVDVIYSWGLLAPDRLVLTELWKGAWQ